MDFGYAHNFAACELAWDRDSDTVYVIKTYVMREGTPVVHCGTLRAWGVGLPWSWPKDGARHTLEGAGVALAEQYRAQGLNMIWQHAQFPDKSVSLEAGVLAMLTRMEAGRFKVFEDLRDFFGEYRLYHRVDGKIRTENDDLLCAVRYGCMMLRFAELRDPPRISRGHYRGKPGPKSWMAT